jgi:hypothetical protein
MAFLDLAFTLLRKIAEYLAQVMAKGFVKHFPAALRDKHNVILAIPFRMAYAGRLVHPVSPLRVLGGSR